MGGSVSLRKKMVGSSVFSSEMFQFSFCGLCN